MTTTRNPQSAAADTPAAAPEFSFRNYRQLLRASFKSADTEEWLDVWFTRPVGLFLALLCGRVGITPNAITIFGIVVGAASGWFFHFTDLQSNIIGVLMLMTANFCDSADGQLARLTGQKSLLGRMLDGFASDAWFFCVYLAVIVRLWPSWGPWGFLLCAVAGLYCHSTQCALADYYRQIHLYFLQGAAGSELATFRREQQAYEAAKARGWSFERIYRFFYKGYCRKQERLTPAFQAMFARLTGGQAELSYGDNFPASWSADRFLAVSRRLMPMTNILTHNTRATVLFFAVIVNIPWVYPLFEIVVLQPLCWYMRYRHERLCREMSNTLASLQQ